MRVVDVVAGPEHGVQKGGRHLADPSCHRRYRLGLAIVDGDAEADLKARLEGGGSQLLSLPATRRTKARLAFS